MPLDEDESALIDDPHWYKDAIIYEIPVRAFYDSDGDGIGDFPGLIQKLDYVQELGATAIWLLPFYPSPLRDGGYDIADYRKVHPMYGTLRDFKRLMKEAHKRGIRVITELVINHTSTEHPWFQRARRAPPGSKYRNWYVWSDSPDQYPDVRIIFQDYEASNWTWDPVAKAYYWHRFYSHQPDLNFDNPDVREEVFRLMDYWLAMGVDGMRLDAIPYLYEREGTNCENLPETHEFLKELRAHIDERFSSRMLLAEANQWPEDASAYFGDGDECHMNFHFPLMPRMFMAVQLENSFPILDIMAQTPDIPDSSQWAIFLRNHDELTLEMVTDEDRDFMYRVYANDPQMRVNLGIRRRLAPLLAERAKVELMNALLFSMPGTPVLYYGDEIGMGDNIYLGDRDSVRTPMQWSGDRNAGFSRANPQKLYLPPIIDPEYHYESTNVEAQHANTSSLLWWTRRIIALRKQYQAFGRGDIAFYNPDNSKVLAFRRGYGDEQLLVVANLSRTPQFVELSLDEHAGLAPIELFGRTEFPVIREGEPYRMTLGPFGFYWFSLEPPATPAFREVSYEPHSLSVRGDWPRVLHGKARTALEKALRDWIPHRRWFRSKARRRRSLTLLDGVALDTKHGDSRILFVKIDYRDGPSETYVVPVAFAMGEEAEKLTSEAAYAVIAHVKCRAGEGVLYDALRSDAFADALIAGMRRRKATKGEASQLRFRPSKAFRALARDADLTPEIAQAEQSNSSVIYGDRMILKLFRVLEQGIHPEEEMGRFLTEDSRFPHVPPLAGSLDLETTKKGGASTLAILQEFIPSQGDAWRFTLDALDRYLDNVRTDAEPPPSFALPLLERSARQAPERVQEHIGPFLPLVALLGQRTAELHQALAAGDDRPAFAPEPLTLLYQRSLYQSARGAVGQTFQTLRRSLKGLPPGVAELAREVLSRRDAVDARLKRIHRRKIEAVRTRTHGDLHLGQVLWTSRDFIFIDFEGEPARPLNERRFKRTPLRDAAGMLRSFQYAAAAALQERRAAFDDRDQLVAWLDVWTDAVTGAWLSGYREAAKDSTFLPADQEDLEVLLDFHLLEKCVYEIGYELDNRPDWLDLPLRGLLALLDR